MKRCALLCLAVVACGLAAAPPAAGGAADRLDRFRTLATSRLTLADVGDPERAGEAYREVLALLDDEIVESLVSGGPFASAAFLQDRLDGFSEAWGGASLRLTRVGPFTVGAFQLGESPGGSAVHVYGTPRGGEPQLLSAFAREGRPTVHVLSPASGGAARFAVVWEGVPSGRGTRAVRVDLVRQVGDDVTVTWSTAQVYPDGLVARAWRLRGDEMYVRYELRYPGWIPGCEGQTEQEDVLRLGADGTGFTRVTRRQHDAWHHALHRSVERLFEALSTGDRAALAAVVPDAALRQRLPAGLAREDACDAPDGPGPAAVSVAASAGEGGPWTLTFRRSGGEWRLDAVAPVLP
ncbi:MAG TPA: hypothetical protein VLF19_07120 [Methylomirabilota bacterium]|nr:hypothetical protein [Methylomirabilota bacterium]